MSILKTTLKVESADSTSKINILTSNNADLTAGVVHRKIKLNADNLTTFTTDQKGARGNYLYVKSSDLNPKHTLIQIENKITRNLITLYAGEYGLIPISNQENTSIFRAKTSYGTAELEYFFGTRGEELGENVLICYDDSNSRNWYFSTLDVSTGTQGPIINSGVKVEEYPSVSFQGVVNRKGYAVRLIGSDGSTSKVIFINSRGTILNNITPINYSFYRGSGKANLLTYYEESTDSSIAIYFDGDTTYWHEFSGTKDIYVDDNWDECTNDGTFPLYVENNNGIPGDSLYLIKGANSKLIKTINGGVKGGPYFNSYVYSNGNFIAVETWDSIRNTITGLEIFNSKGTLLKGVTFNLGEAIANQVFYGTGKLQLAYQHSEGYIFLNYNQLTGKLIGEDLKWKTSRKYIDIVCNAYPIGRSSDANYKPESVAILIYDQNDYSSDQFLNKNTGDRGIDVTYIINNDTKQRNYAVPFSGDITSKATLFYPSGYLHAGINDFVLITGENTSDGPLIATRFTSGAEPTRFNLLDNVRNYYTSGLSKNNWIDTQCFGDYRYLDIPTLVNIPNQKETVPGDRNIIVYDSKVLDKTSVGFNADYSTSGQYNSLILVDWDNEITSYFNTSTKKWVQPKLSGSISDYWTGIAVDDQYPVGLSRQLLVSTNWTPTLTTLYVTPITKGIAGKEKEIIKLDTTNTGGLSWWDLSMSTETIVFSYKYGESDTWKFRVYDLNFNFLYEIDTKVTNLNSALTAGRINFKMLIGDGNIFSFYNFNKLLNNQTIEVKSGRYAFTSNNFSLFGER